MLFNRDLLNHVYFDKRKLYLSVIATSLRNCLLLDTDSVRISYFKGDPRKPIILAKPNFKTKYVVRIIPIVSQRMLIYLIAYFLNKNSLHDTDQSECVASQKTSS